MRTGYEAAPADVNVIIPTHLSPPPFLGATLQSLIAQTFRRWTAVVVNDGSSDHETLQALVSLDPRLSLVHTDQAGVARARNVGIAQGSGPLVAFLDHDDLWYPDHLRLLVGALARVPDAVGAYSGNDFVDEGGSLVGVSRRADVQPTPQTIYSGGPRPVITTLLIRREHLDAIGGFDPTFDWAEDLDLIFRLAERGSFVAVDAISASYRYHDRNMTRHTKAVATAGDRAFQCHLHRLARSDSSARASLRVGQRRARRYYAGAGLRDAARDVREHQFFSAIAMAAWAVSFSPAGCVSLVISGIARRVPPGRTRGNGLKRPARPTEQMQERL